MKPWKKFKCFSCFSTELFSWWIGYVYLLLFPLQIMILHWPKQWASKGWKSRTSIKIHHITWSTNFLKQKEQDTWWGSQGQPSSLGLLEELLESRFYHAVILPFQLIPPGFIRIDLCLLLCFQCKLVEHCATVNVEFFQWRENQYCHLSAQAFQLWQAQ